MVSSVDGFSEARGMSLFTLSLMEVMYAIHARWFSKLRSRSSSVMREVGWMRCGWVRGVGIGDVSGKWDVRDSSEGALEDEDAAATMIAGCGAVK
jgi:hypothetical protein